ncbi:ATP-binding protein [Gynuella sunshinyii]|uniref:histidine kinase n=1 Tax=Gynuella sunshinyii YC6258 TaxID=1445510 RepID=A0A0C5VL58_9GAMM|nr:ATP-binding protein [Gynuella sunshinyii]AJQ95437.1 signal transduction histidine kinase [Gynuella sunshinyii YC6258]
MSYRKNNWKLWLLLVVPVVLLLLTVLYDSQLKVQANHEADAKMSRVSDEIVYTIEETIERQKKNLAFLFGTPPISGLSRAELNRGVDPLDGTRLEQWKQRLEMIFVSMLQNNPEIDQLRVIRFEPEGREMVRVDRLSGKIESRRSAQLQSKADTDYYRRASELSQYELYVSRIDLNKEFGKVEFPYQPTIRMILPMFSEDGSRYAFIVLNMNVSNLLQQVQALVTDETELMLLDNEGYFILHPLKDHRFSRDLNPQYRFGQEYSLELNGHSDSGVVLDITTGSRRPVYLREIRLSADKDSTLRQLVILPENYIQHLVWNKRLVNFGFLTVLFIVMIMGVLIFWRSYSASLRGSYLRAEYEAIVNGSADAIIGLDLSGVVTSFNMAASRLLGLVSKNMRGGLINRFLSFEDEAMNLRKLIADASHKQVIGPIDTRCRGRSGDIMDVSLTVVPIKNENDTVFGVALFLRDISQQKNAERDILQANATLEQEVSHRTEELKQAHQQALQASDFKSVFVSNVSHEMRTPLNGILGAISLVKREKLSANQQKYVEMAEASSVALSLLINDILDISKIEAGKLEFENKGFDLILTIESIVGSTAIRAYEKNIEFIVDITDLKHRHIVSDANRIKQILNNVLGNALKFTHQGNIRLSVSSTVTDDRRVRIDFSVRDTGIGIAKSSHGQLFQNFSQADSSISGKYGGTGLGLSISKQLCRLMGGDINFESEEGKGSHFYFHILLNQEDTTVETIEPELQDQTVALMVPNVELRKLLSRMLSVCGAQLMPDDTLNQLLEGQQVEEKDIPAILISEWSLVAEDDRYRRFIESLGISRLVALCELAELDIASPWHILNKPITPTGFSVAVLGHRQKQDTVVAAESPTNVKLDGRVVLIVDDNEINLEVACGLLNGLGLTLLTARNGKAAIEKLLQLTENNEPLHCILMDCQMPYMDGYQCTREIRRGEAGQKFMRIPIIAMTANAMSGEQAKCIAAGMEDYMTKPIVYEVVLKKLQKWLPVGERLNKTIGQTKNPQEQVVAQEEITEVQPTAEPQLPVWDHASALKRMLNNHNLVNKITRMFIETIPKNMDQLHAVVQQNNMTEVREYSHKIKGLAGDVGAVRLHRNVSMLEDAARANQQEQIDELFGQVQHDYEELMAELEAYMSSIKEIS